VALHQYTYQACDVEGKIHKGQMGAESEQEVVTTLQSRQLIPIEVELTVESGPLFKRQSVSHRDIIDFTNGLCTLVEARIPLDRSLTLLEGLTEKPMVQQLIADLRQDVKEGKSLAQALRAYPDIFSNMVHAGEEGGILEELLPKLADFMTAAEEAKRTIISSLIYPAVLLVTGLLSVILLMVFVVPQFATLFEDMGNTPAAASFLLGTSYWLRSYGWTLLFIPVIVWMIWKQFDTTVERRLQRDRFKLSLPLFGTLILQAESARFCRTLGALLAAGIPLLNGLHIVRGVLENQVLAESLAQVEEAVRAGTSLGKSLVNVATFPVLLNQLVIVGEESGRTSAILNKLAATFDANVKQQTARLVALAEPVLILFLGVIVGAIVVTMLSAIFSINNVNF